MFNHSEGTLTLRVQTDDQLQTEGQKDKDPRSLSGGEKSFSTICLLLSLWDSIGCPLRCLGTPFVLLGGLVADPCQMNSTFLWMLSIGVSA